MSPVGIRAASCLDSLLHIMNNASDSARALLAARTAIGSSDDEEDT